MAERVWREELQFPVEVDTSGIGAHLVSGVVPAGVDGNTLTDAVSGAVIPVAAYTGNRNENCISSTEVGTAALGFTLKDDLNFNSSLHSLILTADIYIGRTTGQSFSNAILGVWNYGGSTFTIEGNGGYSSTVKVWGRLQYNSSIPASNISSFWAHSNRKTVSVHYDVVGRTVDVYLSGEKIITGVAIPAGKNMTNDTLSANLATANDKIYSLNTFMKSGAFTPEEVIEAVSNPYSAYKTASAVTDENTVNEYTVGPSAVFDYSSLYDAFSGAQPATERTRFVASGNTLIGGNFYSGSLTSDASYAKSWEITAAQGEEFTGDTTDPNIATITMNSRGIMIGEVTGYKIQGLRLYVDSALSWAITPTALSSRYGSPGTTGTVQDCWFDSDLAATKGYAMSITRSTDDLTVINCLSTNFWGQGFDARRITNSVVINCRRDNSSSEATALFQAKNSMFINCVADGRTSSNSFPEGYLAKFIGSNNVSSDDGALNYTNSQGNIDFSLAYLDFNSGDYRFTPEFSDTYLLGQGENGSDIASWLWAPSSTINTPINLSIQYNTNDASIVTLVWEQG